MQRKSSFSSTPIPAENLVFTLNAENLTNRFICLRWISLPVAALLFLSGHCVSGEPVGDFFKKVGQSVSNAFQPRSTPNPNEKKTKRAARHPSSRNLTATAASPAPVEVPTVVAKEGNVTPTVRGTACCSCPSRKSKGRYAVRNSGTRP